MNQPSNLDSMEGKLFKGSWAGWKLDVAHAIATDTRLEPSDVRVAVVMLRFASADTLTLYPAQTLLAALARMSINNLATCLKRLKAAGWIQWDRGNRQMANVYRFDANHIADELARVKAEERQHAAARKRRRPISDPRSTVGQRKVPDPQRTVVPDPQPACIQPLKGKIPSTSRDPDHVDRWGERARKKVAK